MNVDFNINRHPDAKLTPKEKIAVRRLIEAAAELPENLALSLDDLANDDEPTLTVLKKLRPGHAVPAGTLVKQSLLF